MPAKDDLQLGPERLGLSERDIMYLLVFRELHKHVASTSDFYEVIREELLTINRGRARSYLYNIVSEMESFGWIKVTLVADKSNKKYYVITASGYEKIDTFRQSFLGSISTLKEMADHFSYIITGSGSSKPVKQSVEQRRMFSRLMNIRHLVRFLFLSILSESEHRAETAKSLWNLLQDRYHWRPAQGYFYELAHEMETEQGYIVGSWTTARRSSYVYRLTDRGAAAIQEEAETAIHYIRELQKYTRFIVNLFPEQHPNPHRSD